MENLADYFEGKMQTHKAVTSPMWAGPYDRVIHDGTVYFYRTPSGTCSEDFADAVSVAFDVDVDAREVTCPDDFFVLHL